MEREYEIREREMIRNEMGSERERVGTEYEESWEVFKNRTVIKEKDFKREVDVMKRAIAGECFDCVSVVFIFLFPKGTPRKWLKP